jgi:hypothetical protein
VPVKVPVTRLVAREGVAAAQSFFEKNNCVFQEVAQQNDFGKDAYVDIVRGGIVTFLCLALQIKSGASYKSANGDYFIPLESHADIWRRSTVPVFGLVYDPTDNLLRWIDLTRYLRGHAHQDRGSVPVSKDAVLNETTLHTAFTRALSRYASAGDTIAFDLLSPDTVQASAVLDAWALGRHDPRYLLLIRRLILDLTPEATRAAIFALGHLTPHPDIFWSERNWIPKEIKASIKPTFRWSPDEIAHMVTTIDPEDWGRGTLGQSFDMLMYEDPNSVAKFHQAIALLLEKSDLDGAVRIAALSLTHSEDQQRELTLLRDEFPILLQSAWFLEILDTVQTFGSISDY